MAAKGAKQSTDDTLVIRDLVTLKVLADPLRQTLLSLLDRERTVKELAKQVGKPPDRLYYHLDLMVEHGLVRAVGERGERRYVAAADRMKIDPDLTITPAVSAELIVGVFGRAADEWARASRRPSPDGTKRSMLAFTHVRLTEEERAEINAALMDVVSRFEARDEHDKKRGRDTSDDGRQMYAVMRGIWPYIEPDDIDADGDA